MKSSSFCELLSDWAHKQCKKIRKPYFPTKMDVEEKTLCFGRHFGYAKIEWEIENYYIETCKKLWSVYSPVFIVRGHQETKWRLNFRGSRTKDKIFASVYLERSNLDSLPHSVQVNWKLRYLWGIHDHYTSENTFTFDKKSSFGMTVYDFESLVSKLCSTFCETLRIQCSMLVYGKESSVIYRATDPGLKSLSQDLAVTCKLGHQSDVLLKTQNSTIEVHKALLFSRVEKLRTKLDEGTVEIELPGMDVESAKKILSFLYTANLDYVLRIPTFHIMECIMYFNIKELENYYNCDELTLSTEIGIREYCFYWFIENTKSKSESCITSNIFKTNLSNLTFRLHLYTNGICGKSENMSIFIEMIEGDCPDNISVEFAITDCYGLQHYQQKMRWTSDNGNKQGLENFVLKDVKDNSTFLWFGMLNISCIICVPASSESLSKVISKVNCNPKTSPEYHYELLSNQISHLFETGKFSDFTIKCEETEFKVHKFILSARSHKFKEIVNKPENTESACIADLEPEILRHMISYMYSGRLEKHELRDVFKIYAAADRFFVLPLKYACTDILRHSIDMINVSEVLKISDQLKDFKLKLSAFKFICKNMELVIEKFRQSKTCNEDLMSEYFKFVRRYATVNQGQTFDADFENHDFSTKCSIR